VFALLNRIPGLAPLGLRIGHVPERRLTFSEPHCVPEVCQISGARAVQEKHKFTKREKIDYGEKFGDSAHR
jgi:hypothetical protein